MVKTLSKSFHVVLSPKECPSIFPIVSYLQKMNAKYVVAQEFGANGHEHLDCYFVLPTEKRQDHIRRAIVGLYPSIPKEELKNIRVIVNTKIPDDRYGFGYSLKEGMQINTNLSEEEKASSKAFFSENSEKIKSIKSEKFSENLTVNKFGSMCVDFVTQYYDGKKFSNEDSVEWLIDEFIFSAKNELKFKENLNLFSKLNYEKLVKFIQLNMGVGLLTDPLYTPPTKNQIEYVTSMLDQKLPN